MVDVPGGVGLTAVGVALVRAVESRRADRLFDDPLAAAFATAAGLELPPPGQELDLGPHWSSMPHWIVVRTKFLDDLVVDAVAGGCRQLVILAAGLDARAFRLPLPDDATTFELDTDEVLAFKEHVVSDGGHRSLGRRVVVPIDLRLDWAAALQQAGWDPSAPTCWLVEGLLVYLEPEDIEALLSAIDRGSAPGSRIGITSRSRAGVEARRREVAGDFVVDLWRSGVPDDPVGWLAGHGWNATAFDAGERLQAYGRAAGSLDSPPELLEGRR